MRDTAQRARTLIGRRRRELGLRLRHGSGAPRFHELIWVRPDACVSALRAGVSEVPTVSPGDWDRAVRPVEEVAHVRFCLQHWVEGTSWEETGAYADMLAKIAAGERVAGGARTLDDVVRRYERLDEVFAEVARQRRLLTRAELPGASFRERGGILVHVARDGTPIFNGFNGCHRLAMAKVLDLAVMPAQVGWVHTGALSQWRTQYRAGAPAPG